MPAAEQPTCTLLPENTALPEDRSSPGNGALPEDAALPEDEALPDDAALPDDKVLVTVNDRRFVIDAACPHRKGRLAFAHVNANTLRITCPLHRSTYDLTDGRQISGPAACALNVEEVR